MAEEARRHLALVGLPGAGKSTVGGLLAERLGRTFIDTDQAVEEASGVTVAQLWAERGEVGFRALEAEAVDAALRGADPVVISLGGGAVLTESVRQALADHAFVVWLDVPVTVLAARLRADATTRPVAAAADPTDELQALLEARAAHYGSVADLTVQPDGASAADLADRVADQVVGVTP